MLGPDGSPFYSEANMRLRVFIFWIVAIVSNGFAAEAQAFPASVQPQVQSVRLDITKSPFFAVNDGHTDATKAIRRAISTACNSGGGTVYFPRGSYVISPQSSEERSALTIPCNGVSLTGDGMGISVITRKALGGGDPDLTCPTRNGEVNRGSGIFVTAELSGDHTRRDIHIDHLSLLGNRTAHTGMKGSHIWPASVGRCSDVWDTSDRGIWVEQDHNSENITIDSVEVGYFSGELIYGGSQYSLGWKITNCNLHHSNGDAISVSAAIVVMDNTLHDLGGNGIENQPFGMSESQAISKNTIYNVALDGIGVMTYDKRFYDASTPEINVYENHITDVARFGIVLLATKGGHIHDNLIADSGFAPGTACGIGVIGTLDKGTYQVPRNVEVRHNDITAQRRVVSCGIQVWSPPLAGIAAYNIAISDNKIGPTVGQPSNAPVIKHPIEAGSRINQLSTDNNHIY